MLAQVKHTNITPCGDLFPCFRPPPRFAPADWHKSRPRNQPKKGENAKNYSRDNKEITNVVFAKIFDHF